MRHWFASAISLWRCAFSHQKHLSDLLLLFLHTRKNLTLSGFFFVFIHFHFFHVKIRRFSFGQCELIQRKIYIRSETLFRTRSPVQVCVCALNFMLDNTNYRSSWFYDNQIVQMMQISYQIDSFLLNVIFNTHSSWMSFFSTANLLESIKWLSSKSILYINVHFK